jgi:hypothetical protein
MNTLPLGSMARPKTSKKRDTSAACLLRHSLEPKEVQPQLEPKQWAKPRPAYKIALDTMQEVDEDDEEDINTLVAKGRVDQRAARFLLPDMSGEFKEEDFQTLKVKVCHPANFSTL